MRLKQFLHANTKLHLPPVGIFLSRFAVVVLIVTSGILTLFDVSLTASAFVHLHLNSIAPPSKIVYSSIFFGFSEQNNSRRSSNTSHLMIRSLQTIQKQSSRLLAMANDKKRMISNLGDLPYVSKRRASSLDTTQQEPYRPLVVVLAGPTAVGKSDVAAELCSPSISTDILQSVKGKFDKNHLKTRGHIISADSVQVYRGVDIGANKPSLEERERTPHHLVDIVDAPHHISQNQTVDQRIDSSTPLDTRNFNKVSSYNAADWMRDAEYIIRKLTLCSLDENYQRPDTNTTALDEESITRRSFIDTYLEESLSDQKERVSKQPILPVVVGGTMMYLTWLVHGRPDAIRPTNEAINKAASVVSSFQPDGKADETSKGGSNEDAETTELNRIDDETAWNRAKMYVASLGPLFADRVSKLSGKDWYRLRRLLEVAYTVSYNKMKTLPSREGCDKADEASILHNLTDSEIYTGIRSGSLSDAGFDVRCFFLCPNERMLHFHTVDQRCEDMILSGLLKETANLYLNGGLPEDSQVARAIGYRQALEYLLREDAKMGDMDTFLAFIDDFATATRQYAKKQMQWFRKDSEFVFIPVNMDCNKADRVRMAAGDIADMCKLSRNEFEAQLYFDPVNVSSDDEKLPVSARMKMINEKQGKGMKFFISKRAKLTADSAALKDAILDADKLTKLLHPD